MVYVPAKSGKPDFDYMATIVRDCAGFDVVRSFRKAYEHYVAIEAKALMKSWIEERRPSAKVAKMIQHPAYRRLVSFGNAVVPLLLNELRREPDHWFHALHQITGANPVPDSDRGNVSMMAAAWVKWGQSHGIIK